MNIDGTLASLVRFRPLLVWKFLPIHYFSEHHHVRLIYVNFWCGLQDLRFWRRSKFLFSNLQGKINFPCREKFNESQFCNQASAINVGIEKSSILDALSSQFKPSTPQLCPHSIHKPLCAIKNVTLIKNHSRPLNFHFPRSNKSILTQ